MTDGIDRRTILATAASAITGSSLAGCVAPGSAPRRGSGSGSPGSGPGDGPMGPGDGSMGPGDGPMGPGSSGGPHGSGRGTHRGPMYGDGATRAPGNAGQGGGSIADWMTDVDNYDGPVDRRNRSGVTVRVGATGNGGYFAFAPPAIRVSPGMTVTWEWTGRGGVHDVAALGGGFASDRTAAAGATFDVAFDERRTHRYYCTPHRSLGMKGVVVVD